MEYIRYNLSHSSNCAGMAPAPPAAPAQIGIRKCAVDTDLRLCRFFGLPTDIGSGRSNLRHGGGCEQALFEA